MNKLSITFTPEQLRHIIFDLCDLPEKFTFRTVVAKIDLHIERNNYLLESAKLQESLRKRFSSPERMKMNQSIIKKYTESI